MFNLETNQGSINSKTKTKDILIPRIKAMGDFKGDVVGMEAISRVVGTTTAEVAMAAVDSGEGDGTELEMCIWNGSCDGLCEPFGYQTSIGNLQDSAWQRSVPTCAIDDMLCVFAFT
jgi:hypothetical protein